MSTLRAEVGCQLGSREQASTLERRAPPAAVLSTPHRISCTQTSPPQTVLNRQDGLTQDATVSRCHTILRHGKRSGKLITCYFKHISDMERGWETDLVG